MDETLLALSQHRIEQAQQCLRSANVLAGIEDYKGAANRSYYAIFNFHKSLSGKNMSNNSKIILNTNCVFFDNFSILNITELPGAL